MDLAVIILAAGKGKRMKSELPKVIHPILGRPMLSFVIDSVRELSPKKIAVVVGHGAEKVKEVIGTDGIEYVIQAEQLGTGHAALCAKQALLDFNGNILILNGDFPLITPKTLRYLAENHIDSLSIVSLLTAELKDPKGYGRILRDMGLRGIVEEKDATPDQRKIHEVNSGAYCVRSDFLWDALEGVGTENEQREYYLPDIVRIAVRSDRNVSGFLMDDCDELLGVNSRAELASVQAKLRERTNENLMLSGVTIIDPASTYVSPVVPIGIDTVIYPNTFIYGNTKIGRGCKIGPSVWIEDSKIGNDVSINFCCYITKAMVDDKVSVGPFAHLRPEAQVLAGAKIGNFVEIKKSKIGKGSKVPHLSYVGDATLGERVNIGAGTITCNYDGFHKHETIIEDDVFIGSDTMLVAPIKVGKGATTGAGSTINKDVPPESLAIGRAKQVVFDGWKRKPKEKKEGE